MKKLQALFILTLILLGNEFTVAQTSELNTDKSVAALSKKD
ncbi:MAG TPA: hypothetical protein VFH07_05335 [Chitinophagaceae bacterium]|nr:hypothetical protein [Chitinophagaceae bacterium]